ncbi:MAG: hypothetical protein WC989_05995 [Micavibrio sp.]
MFVLMACIGLVGVIGAVAVDLVRGPVRAMAHVTKRTVAENQMMASAKLAIVMSAHQSGDCDGDGMIEPVEWRETGGLPGPLNGGFLPASIGAALQDPWGGDYGYCVWDLGSMKKHASCGGEDARRLRGGTEPGNPVIAIISAGPDRIFQTGCRPHGHADFILRLPDNDDVVMTYSMAEAIALSGGLWELKDGRVDTATIAKNLSVTDESGAEQMTFNAAARLLTVGAGGSGHMPNIRTDFVQSLTPSSAVEFLSGIKSASLSVLSSGSSGAGSVAATIHGGGAGGIGLRVGGMAKALEVDGLLDMTEKNIVNLAEPENSQDAATKRYVDDKLGGGAQKIKCEPFVFNGCAGGGAAQNFSGVNLGGCKTKCEQANAQCCEAVMVVDSGPNAALSSCRAYQAPARTGGALRSLLGDLLGGILGLSDKATMGAFCYLE